MEGFATLRQNQSPQVFFFSVGCNVNRESRSNRVVKKGASTQSTEALNNRISTFSLFLRSLLLLVCSDALRQEE